MAGRKLAFGPSKDSNEKGKDKDKEKGKDKAASSDQLPLIEISDEDEDAEQLDLDLDPTSLEKCNACGSSVSHHHISNRSPLCQKIMIIFSGRSSTAHSNMRSIQVFYLKIIINDIIADSGVGRPSTVHGR